MADIRPFRAVRPAEGLAGEIAALPYDVYDEREAREETLRSPLSFLRIDRPETMFPEGTDVYAPQVYQAAGKAIAEMLERGEFVQEDAPCYYIYELEEKGLIQDGIVGCASIDDYQSGVIRKHEETRPEKVEDRVRHIEACGMQTGPIFLAYRGRGELNALVERVKRGEALCRFVSDDGVRHQVWRVDAPGDIRLIAREFGQVDSIYIADGHHRAASAVKVGLRRRQDAPAAERESDYFLSVLFPAEQLHILDYDRVVRDLYGHSAGEFLELVQGPFAVTEEAEPVKPCGKGSFGMYMAGKWYRLELREEEKAKEQGLVESLDVSRLQRHILEPLLGIEDPRRDERIDFIGGLRVFEELEKRVEDGWAVAFTLYPTSMEELMAVADAGLLMPPKSTWFEPKLRSGLFLHEL